MILRAGAVPTLPDDASREALGDAGGLTQLGVYRQTLRPGEQTSERHWHEHADELVLVLDGEVTVVEDDGDHVLGPGDAAVWPAGVRNAHHVVNRSARSATLLVVGTRMAVDVVTYPEAGRQLRDAAGRWQLVQQHDGTVLGEGTIEQARPLRWDRQP